jgi:hypothetical protein
VLVVQVIGLRDVDVVPTIAPTLVTGDQQYRDPPGNFATCVGSGRDMSRRAPYTDWPSVHRQPETDRHPPGDIVARR